MYSRYDRLIRSLTGYAQTRLAMEGLGRRFVANACDRSRAPPDIGTLTRQTGPIRSCPVLLCLFRDRDEVQRVGGQCGDGAEDRVWVGDVAIDGNHVGAGLSADARSMKATA